MEQVVQPFSIGVSIKKKKKKIKKKVTSRNIAYYYGNYYIYNFQLYNGPRWRIPEKLNVSESFKSKFSSLETVMSFREIKFKIAENIRNIKFRFDSLPTTEWKPPKNVQSSIVSFYAKQENEWNKVRALYFRLFKLRSLILPLILNWQIRKCIKNCKNTEDPVTMEIPKNPVSIIDFPNRISFVYDANTLKKTIENRLLFSDYMFPEPLAPVNLLTNQPFTIGQLISVITQCKNYGKTSWILESLKSVYGDLQLFLAYNKQLLKIEAIRTFFKKSSYIVREAAIDYFKIEADYYELPDAQHIRFIRAYDLTPNMPVVQAWIGLTREYYIAKELNDPSLLTSVASKTETTLNTVYKVFQHSSV